jgi:phytoene dehydrogenase-like protein
MAPTQPRATLDAVVVGAGPNGLAAAITLARAGRRVRVYEAAEDIGGGLRTEELTLPGCRHDVCATIMPLVVASPFFRSVDLAARGVRLAFPEASFGHPLDGGRAMLAERSMDRTAEGLGGRDGDAWRRLLGPLVERADDLDRELLGPVPHLPRHPLLLARFGLPALRSAMGLGRAHFREAGARALFAGAAAHAMLDLRRPLSAAVGLVLAVHAHASGWPLVVGGSSMLAGALADELRSLGGEVVTGHRVGSVAQLPPSRVVFLDVTPHQALGIAGERLSWLVRRQAARFRHGPGVFKVDWVLDGPVPWAAEGLRRTATVHLGGTAEELAASEAAVAAGHVPDRPFVLFVQYAPWDETRAPDGRATAWAYCHVPNGCGVDMTQRIEDQVERFAPGFRDRVVARHVMGPADLEAHDENHVGGDINGGIQDIRQLVFRPWPAIDPYRIGRGLYLCSASTPPGGGIHGMCGMLAARSALRHELR